MDCKFYCMVQAGFCVVFLFYLFLLVAFGSQTLYIEIKHRVTSALVLFVSAGIYAGIFVWLYSKIYIDIDRKLELRRWLEEKRKERKGIHQMREITRQSQIVTERRSALPPQQF